VIHWIRRLKHWVRLVVDSRAAWGMRRVEDAPDSVLPELVYLVGDVAARPWLAVFVCPCGCGEIVSLSLIRGDSPRWRARTHSDRTVTISPSIWRTRGCRSHFFIRRGKVVWAQGVVDSGPGR